MSIDWNQHAHRRFNPLTGDWVLVSPQRAGRPWLGATENTATPNLPRYDPACYLCPGNERAGGMTNPHYQSTLIFDNDFPALLPNTLHAHFGATELLKAETERGLCRVACFSPRHDLTIPAMDLPAISAVVDLWRDQYSELAAFPWVNHVQIFENRGQMMGASNPHPHCQIWANAAIPDVVARETRTSLHMSAGTGLVCCATT